MSFRRQFHLLLLTVFALPTVYGQDNKATRSDEFYAFKGHISTLDFAPKTQRILVAGAAIERDQKRWNKHLVPGVIQIVHRDGGAAVAREEVGAITEAKFSPSCSQFVTCGQKLAEPGVDEIRLWDAKTLTTQKILHSSRINIYSILFAPNGKHVIASSDSQLWSIPIDESHRMQRVKLKGDVDGIVSAPDGKNLICNTRHNGVFILNAKDLSTMRHFAENENALQLGLDISPDGKRLAVGGEQNGLGYVQLWNIQSGKKEQSFQLESLACSVSFSDDGKFIIATGNDLTIRGWEIATRRQVVMIQRNSGSSADVIRFLPNTYEFMFTDHGQRTLCFAEIKN